MRRAFGPRTIFEAAFLVAVPVVALAAGLGRWTIVAASAVAYLFVLLFEATLWRAGVPSLRRRRRAPVPEAEPAQEPVVAEIVEAVEVRASEPEPEPEPAPAAPEPEPEPEPAAEPEPQREPVGSVRVLRPEPAPAEERPPLAAVPEPEPEPEPEPVPAASTVVPIGVGAAPQRWNLWDLERLSREHSGADATLNEERTFLLMYLREFADPDGLLPLDFDRLVRDTFGDLVGAR